MISGKSGGEVKAAQNRREDMTTNNLMLVIRATNHAAKVLASVQDQLGLIVEAAQGP